jgi:hypothetical protein
MRHIGENLVQGLKKETHVCFQVVMADGLREINFNIIFGLLDS